MSLQCPLCKCQTEETLAKGRSTEVCVADLGKGSTDIATPRPEHSREFVFIRAGPKGCQDLCERNRHVIFVTLLAGHKDLKLAGDVTTEELPSLMYGSSPAT